LLTRPLRAASPPRRRRAARVCCSQTGRAALAAGNRVTAVNPCRTYPRAAVRSAPVSIRPLPGEFERCLRLRRTDPQLSAPAFRLAAAGGCSVTALLLPFIAFH